MRNVEFYTLHDFLCIDAHDLGYLGLIFPTCPNAQNRYKLTLIWLLHLSNAYLVLNVEFNTLNDMPMIWGFWCQYP